MAGVQRPHRLLGTSFPALRNEGLERVAVGTDDAVADAESLGYLSHVDVAPRVHGDAMGGSEPARCIRGNVLAPNGQLAPGLLVQDRNVARLALVDRAQAAGLRRRGVGW